ncbi:MAG: DUF2156 domain-containing protein [Peptostreptococcaceae bacterium]
MVFKNIDLNSKKELEDYLDLVKCEASEYSFTTLYMWQHAYNTRYYIEDDFAVIIEDYKEDSLSVQLLASMDNKEKALDFTLTYLGKEKNKIHLRDLTCEVANSFKCMYENRFECIEDRDCFEYIYNTENLIHLSGRKNRKRRNHINVFLNYYKDRYEYKLLDESNFEECVNLMKSWIAKKRLEDKYEESMDKELFAIEKVFLAYEVLKCSVKVAGVYVDSKLEAFTIGEQINDNMALIHIEKANPNIRGLYAFINQQFLANEFEDVDFVNREEDLGLDGLRESKLSYHPCRFVEKYIIREV